MTSEPQGRTIDAIVLDTNVFGKGLPNIETISAWAEACERNGAELWIPEPVALELAEHAIAASREIAQLIRDHNGKRTLWGVARIPVPDCVTVDEILDQLEQHGAVIVKVSEEAAQAALRDQILVEGPASVIQGVKTGAADSAWVRTIVENGADGGLIVVSSDKRAMEFLRAHCESEGYTAPTVVRSLGEIRTLLNESSVADVAQTDLFLAALPDRPEETSELRDLTDIGRWTWWDRPGPSAFSTHWEEQASTFEVRRAPELVSDVSYDAWTEALSARVRFSVFVEQQYVSLDSDEIVIFDDSFEAWIEGDVAVTKGEDGEWYWTEFENVELLSEDR